MLWRTRKKPREREIEDEIEYHLAMLASERMEEGCNAVEARHSARRKLGNKALIKEATREMWRWNSIETLWQDLHYAFRQLRQSPGFAFVSVMTLALGIGANTAIFSLLNGVLLRVLPGVRSPDGVVLFNDGNYEGSFKTNIPDPGPLPLYSYPLYERLRDHAQLFGGIAAQQSSTTGVNVQAAGSEADGTANEASGRCVTANYFDVLGVSAFRGRTFRSEDQTAPGANPVLILSYGYWQRRFGGNPAVLGSRLIVNGWPYTVIGVTPPDFMGTKVGAATDLWVPVTMQAQLMRRESLLSRDAWWLLVIGRIKPGVSFTQAQANFNVTLQQYFSEVSLHRDELAGRKLVRIELLPGAKGVSPLRRRFGLSLMVLMAGVGLLLLIACINISHLLLARSIRRQREISLRLALGAGRIRVLRQLLTEGLLFSLLGGIAGLVLGRWCSYGLLHLASPGPVSLAVDVSADARVLMITSLLTIATGVLFSLAPMWHASRIELNASLQAMSRSVSGSIMRRSFGRLLLISQVALSLLLLVGAGLLVQTLRNLKNFDKGFREERVLLVNVGFRLAGLTPVQTMIVYQQLLDQISVLPEVRSASLALQTPLSGNTDTTDISLPGRTAPWGTDREVEVMVVTPSYFETMGMSLAQGRRLTSDDRANTPKVAVINEAMARKVFDSKALHRRFRAGGQEGESTVIGVVRNAKLLNLRDQVRPVMYLPLAQSPDFLKSIQIRTVGDPVLLASQIRQIVRNVNPNLPVMQVTTLHDQVDRSLVEERLVAILSSAFGSLALLLVCIGLYGVLSQAVAQRTAEIGVRMALGAERRQVQWLVLREALLLVLFGIATGLPIALVAARGLTRMLFGLSPVDPLILSGACTAIVIVAALAGYLPARRASRVDPIVALRYE
jgi:predicted permease